MGEHGSVTGRVQPGNIDLRHRPVVHNRDGTVSTERSIGVGTGRGRETIIPTVVGGHVVSDQTALEHYLRSGQNLGTYNSVGAANRAAAGIHDEQARRYGDTLGAAFEAPGRAIDSVNRASLRAGEHRFVQTVQAGARAIHDVVEPPLDTGAHMVGGRRAYNVPTAEPMQPGRTVESDPHATSDALASKALMAMGPDIKLSALAAPGARQLSSRFFSQLGQSAVAAPLFPYYLGKAITQDTLETPDKHTPLGDWHTYVPHHTAAIGVGMAKGVARDVSDPAHYPGFLALDAAAVLDPVARAGVRGAAAADTFRAARLARPPVGTVGERVAAKSAPSPFRQALSTLGERTPPETFKLRIAGRPPIEANVPLSESPLRRAVQKWRLQNAQDALQRPGRLAGQGTLARTAARVVSPEMTVKRALRAQRNIERQHALAPVYRLQEIVGRKNRAVPDLETLPETSRHGLNRFEHAAVGIVHDFGVRALTNPADAHGLMVRKHTRLMEEASTKAQEAADRADAIQKALQAIHVSGDPDVAAQLVQELDRVEHEAQRQTAIAGAHATAIANTNGALGPLTTLANGTAHPRLAAAALASPELSRLREALLFGVGALQPESADFRRSAPAAVYQDLPLTEQVPDVVLHTEAHPSLAKAQEALGRLDREISVVEGRFQRSAKRRRPRTVAEATQRRDALQAEYDKLVADAVKARGGAAAMHPQPHLETLRRNRNRALIDYYDRFHGLRRKGLTVRQARIEIGKGVDPGSLRGASLKGYERLVARRAMPDELHEYLGTRSMRGIQRALREGRQPTLLEQARNAAEEAVQATLEKHGDHPSVAGWVAKLAELDRLNKAIEAAQNKGGIFEGLDAPPPPPPIAPEPAPPGGWIAEANRQRGDAAHFDTLAGRATGAERADLVGRRDEALRRAGLADRRAKETPTRGDMVRVNLDRALQRAGMTPDEAGVRGVVDTATAEADDLRGAGFVRDGVVEATHVTDDPAVVTRLLEQGKPLAAGRAGGAVGDLGSSGLYVSDAPQVWMGRARGKWDFLLGLEPDERTRLADAVHGELGRMYGNRSLTNHEYERAVRSLNEFREAGNNRALVTLAEQPYNIAAWKPDFLGELNIAHGTQPSQVPVEARGVFAELTRANPSPKVVALLKRAGFDGAFTRGGMATTPQLVIWNSNAVLRFGDWKARPRPAPTLAGTQPDVLAGQRTVQEAIDEKLGAPRHDAAEHPFGTVPVGANETLGAGLSQLRDFREKLVTELERAGARPPIVTVVRDQMLTRRAEIPEEPGATRAPMSLGRTAGIAQARFTAPQVAQYGLAPPDAARVDPSITHKFTGREIELGDVTANRIDANIRSYLRAVKLTFALAEHRRLLGVATPARENEWQVPIRADKKPPAELKAAMRESDAGLAIDASSLAGLGDGDLEAIYRHLHGLDLPWVQELVSNPSAPMHKLKITTDRVPIGSELQGVRWVDRRYLVDPAATTNAFLDWMDNINNPMRTLLLYARGGYLANLPGNWGMQALTQGWAAPRMYQRAFGIHEKYGADDASKIIAHVGEGRARGQYQPSGFMAGTNDWLSSFWGKFVDKQSRVSSWLYWAERHGVNLDDPAAVHALLNHPKMRTKLEDVNRRANKDLVEFNSMSPAERDYFRRMIFVYPWVSRAFAWSLRFLSEHPVKAAVLAQGGRLGTADQEKLIARLAGGHGDLVSYLRQRGYLALPGGQLVGTAPVNTFQTSDDVGSLFAGLARGGQQLGSGSEPRAFESPALSLISGVVTGESRTGRAYKGSRVLGAIADLVMQTPQVQAIRRTGLEVPELGPFNPGGYVNPGDPLAKQPVFQKRGIGAALIPLVASSMAPQTPNWQAEGAKAQAEYVATLSPPARAAYRVHAEWDDKLKLLQAHGIARQGWLPKTKAAIELRARREAGYVHEADRRGLSTQDLDQRGRLHADELLAVELGRFTPDQARADEARVLADAARRPGSWSGNNPRAKYVQRQRGQMARGFFGEDALDEVRTSMAQAG